MAAYSLDLRTRVVRAFDRGRSAAAVAEQFDESLAWVYRLVRGGERRDRLSREKQIKFRRPRPLKRSGGADWSR